MFSIPELAMPKTRKITTFCNGKKEVWTEREEAKDYFIRQMMTAEGENYDHYSAIYIQLIHGMSYCTD